jgi:hypothetical protein
MFINFSVRCFSSLVNPYQTTRHHIQETNLIGVNKIWMFHGTVDSRYSLLGLTTCRLTCEYNSNVSEKKAASIFRNNLVSFYHFWVILFTTLTSRKPPSHIKFQVRSLSCEKGVLASSSLSLSFRLHGTVRLPPDGFLWNLIWVFFRKCVRNSQVSLKSDKNDGYFIRRQGTTSFAGSNYWS